MSLSHRSTPVKVKPVNLIVDTATGVTCEANLTFLTTNTVMSATGTGFTTVTWDGNAGPAFYNWLIGAGLSNFDVYAQPTSGSFTSGSANTWQQLGVAQRTWRKSSGVNTGTVTFRLRFRSNTTQQEITSANVQVTLTATNEGTTTDTK